MTYAAVAVAALALLVAALEGVLLWLSFVGREKDRRGHDRRVDDLLNRLAHASKNPWLPAPADEQPLEEGPPARVLDLVDADQELP